MEAFLSLYSVIDWILRGASVAAQTLALGGVAYFLFTLAPVSYTHLTLPTIYSV